MWLHYTPSGHIFISPEDDCNAIVDVMLATGYNEEFCLAQDFSPEFAARLMEAGFLLMSVNVADKGEDPFYLMFPKLHLTRSAMLFENLHVKKSIRRFLPRFELRADVDFDYIISRCIEKHGNDWLTPPLVGVLKSLRMRDDLSVMPVSFGVYREGELKAGEIGVALGRIYTSYSGYYEEDNAGTVQMILMAKWLNENGFSFLDFGMPLDYKTDLGARNISPLLFVELFREGKKPGA